ncbi:arginase family protein [Terrarubrum flagellatum]|uniref:arginase family protein n=1 Tax=Terrirubrum flagellatum TaxID=2895980 RepID=UPI003145314E
MSSQPFLAGLAASGEADLVDARDLAPRLRIVASRGALRSLDARLNEAASQGANIFFLGSGDFHHLAFPLLRRFDQRVTVIHFDNHPDWVRFPGSVNCGSWINKALALSHVEKIITIGPSGDDLAQPELKTANLEAIRQGRLEVHAWRAAETKLWGAAVDAPGVRTEGGRLVWRNLANESWSDFLDDLCARLPDCGLWLSIDKDVVGADEAITNWDQGGMSLDHVVEAIEKLAAHRPILGADICGDYSPPRFRDPFRAFLSYTDRPNSRPSPINATAVNDTANRRLFNAFEKVAA